MGRFAKTYLLCLHSLIFKCFQYFTVLSVALT